MRIVWWVSNAFDADLLASLRTAASDIGIYPKGTEMKNRVLQWLTALLILSPHSLLAVPHIINHVPSYQWYHGCSPTASASILGYWDLNGYGNLFDAEGWEDVRRTRNVMDHISSPAHNAKYDSNPDNSGLPDPPDTSIADFMGTSEGNLPKGATYIDYIDDALMDYPAYRGYQFTSRYVPTTWEVFTGEIDAGMPVLLNVDSTGDGGIDHSITGIGFEDRGENGLWYASYNTWHEAETIDWYPWRSMSSEYRFGVHSMINVHPSERGVRVQPVPEPSTLILFAIGMIGIAGWRKRAIRKNHQYPSRW